MRRKSSRGAAEQYVDRHVVVFASNVPQCLVETGKCRHQHIAAAKEGRAIDVLPMVFNAQRVFADEIVGKLFDRGDGALGLVFERGFAPAHQPVIGADLHQAHPWAGEELFDLGDFHEESFGFGKMEG